MYLIDYPAEVRFKWNLQWRDEAPRLRRLSVCPRGPGGPRAFFLDD